MSRAFTAAFLKKIGAAAPGVGAAIDSTILDADKRRRDAQKAEDERILNEIVRKKYLTDIANQEQQNSDQLAASARSRLAQEAMKIAQSRINNASELSEDSGGLQAINEWSASGAKPLPGSTIEKTVQDVPKTPSEIIRSEAGQYMDQEPVKNAITSYQADEKIEKGIGGGGLSGWTQRSKDWDAISQMPEGEEKENAKVAYLYKWAPSSGYAASPEGITHAVNRAVAVETATSPIKTATAANSAAASEQAKRSAGVTLSETSAERLGDFGASLSQLNELTKSFANPDAPQGPISQIRKLNPYDWEAQAKQQLVASTKQLIGKALEGGVLRKEDEDKYNKILPTIGDTFQSANQKAQNLQTMLNNAYAAKRKGLESAGYDVSKFPNSYNSEEKAKPKIPGAKPKETSGPVQIKNESDYNALPSGAQYIDPNGKLRRKK